MPYYPHFNLLKVFQDAFEIYRLAEEEEGDEEEEIQEEEEVAGEEEEEAEEEEEVEDEYEEEMEAVEEEEENVEDEEVEEEDVEEEEVEEEEEENVEEEDVEEDVDEVVVVEEEEEEEKEEWEAIDIDTTLSALKITLPSCLSPPYEFAPWLLIWGNPDEAVGSVAWMLNTASTSCSSLDEEPSSQEEESLNTLRLTHAASSGRKLQKQKVTELVNLLILKYRMKEPINKVEMLRVVTKDYEKQFPIIFDEASKCLEMIFGIDIKENDPISSSYVLTNSLDLTYYDMVTNNQRMPRNGFLIITLGVIFIEGNRASEESMWEFLNMMGIYDGKEHFIFGEPREFLTRELVYQNYLQYQQVPESYPPRYEFLWGPRAYIETSKMKVLEFLTKFTSRAPTYFSSLYSEAFRDEEERT
ncbi:melanoma-associated antigen 1-like [Acomys russatus]|uniref:melanoma-associated antigen 1-like n=1 Tax=Acomys russatus TaxID=60746 RepID=UPI0021E1D496|nr:melanoma-associated antigen 1-like [Acomys russatus]